jgi:phosphotransferase system enzyme I (PtsP)
MLRQTDSYWHERLRDLDELSDRLLRILAGRPRAHAATDKLPHDTRADRPHHGRGRSPRLRPLAAARLVLEDSGGQSHVAIVAKALGIAAVGNARGVMERVDQGNPIIVDAETGEVHIRPSSEVITAYGDKARFRARRHRRYRELRDRPAMTKDGQRIEIHINAGLLMDVPHLAESGADGIGLYRTELQFMVSATLPRLEQQTQMYRAVVAEAGQKPVVFRTLDVGGDKALPYLRQQRKRTRRSAGAPSVLGLDRPACCAPRCARCCAPRRGSSCGCCCRW